MNQILGQNAQAALGPLLCWLALVTCFSLNISKLNLSDAPLVLEKPLISTHMADNFDFYKPICGMSTEFPRVDGKNSIGCYLGAIEICYNEFRRRSILYKSQSNSAYSNNFY